MLLPGHLPNVPLLPAHMSFIGKDLNTAPQIRVARAMCVKDGSSSEDVVTVRQGTSLPVAADLMVAKKVSGLPVIDAEERLVGILTEGDFLGHERDGGVWPACWRPSCANGRPARAWARSSTTS